MNELLRFGFEKIGFRYDENRFETIGSAIPEPALSDLEIGSRLDIPYASSGLNEIVIPGDKVLIVVPDATRQAGAGQVVNLLVRRLIANGTMPHDLGIIFATGIHRTVTDDEKSTILTSFVVQRIKTLDHVPRDLMKIVRICETDRGIPVELNRALTEYDKTIIVGSVNYHYFAGFTGGRKLICPGLASSRTIADTHRLAFDFVNKRRADGVEVGNLSGNPVHEAFTEAVSHFPPSFAVNTLTNGDGAVKELICGDWRESHEKACDIYSETHSVKISAKRELVVVSCGGFPHDMNMIQAHKALEMAARACSDNGTIVFLAECRDGLGRDDFLDWFDAGSTRQLGDRLAENYKVNGQTAWSLSEKSERFNIFMMTGLPFEAVEKMGMRQIDDPGELDRLAKDAESGYIMPFGARFLPRI